MTFEKENLWIWKTCQWLPEGWEVGKGFTIKEQHDRILRVRTFLPAYSCDGREDSVKILSSAHHKKYILPYVN